MLLNYCTHPHCIVILDKTGEVGVPRTGRTRRLQLRPLCDVRQLRGLRPGVRVQPYRRSL